MTDTEACLVISFVAEQIRGARAFHNIGLRECAKASHISIATLSRVERGGIPDAITFLKMTDWLRRQAGLPQ